jgi:hypothetical protein
MPVKSGPAAEDGKGGYFAHVFSVQGPTARTDCRGSYMTAQKFIMTLTTLIGGAVGLLAPIGFVKWLLRTDPEEAGILTLFFFPVWCLLVVLGLLIGRRAGRLATGGKRVAQR